MSEETKRTTVYLDPSIHKALKLKAVETNQSISNIINNALIATLNEDKEDLQAFRERDHESVLSFEQLLAELKKHGKI